MFTQRTLAVSSIVLTALLYGCASNTPSDEEQRTYDPSSVRNAVATSMEDCTEAHGYDPHTVADETSGLVEGELEWRNCMYQALENKVIPRSRVPNEYRNLIEQDKAMTRAIQDGRLTREDRQVRLDEVIRDIHAAEAGAVVASDPEISAERAKDEAQFIRRVMRPMRY